LEGVVRVKLAENKGFDAFQAFGDASSECQISFISGLIALPLGQPTATEFLDCWKLSARSYGFAIGKRTMTMRQNLSGRTK
jgi:hypothetical protein